MKFFGGVEGGATHSHLIICNEKGEAVATTSGLGTNHWALGIPECARRIADMVERAKTEAGIPLDTPLASLGLSLSGCEQTETNRELESEMRNTFPLLADTYDVCSDTLGSVFTASPHGGMVVIAGTGSNALLRNPDGSTHSCGGWGHMLGDEGGAWHIAFSAVKYVFDDMDGYASSPHPVAGTWKLIQQHFNVQNRFDLLPHCYGKFDKPFFASLCKRLSLAADDGEPLAVHLFRQAGRQIARSVAALLPHVQNELVKEDGLNIVCVGSVWLSWHLLRDGFVETLSEALSKRTVVYDVKLVRITKTMAYGACYLGADVTDHPPLPRNYADNFHVMYEFPRTGENVGGNGSANGRCASPLNGE